MKKFLDSRFQILEVLCVMCCVLCKSKHIIRNTEHLILSFFLTIFLSSCGFTPVYKNDDSDSSARKELYEVEIEPIKGERAGQELSSHLEDLFNPEKINLPSKYQLTAGIRTDKVSQAVRKSGEITRYNIVMTVKYELREIATAKTIYKNTSIMRGSFDAVGSDFGTYIAEEDTRSKLAKEAAQDIKMHISSFFHQAENTKDRK